MKLFAKLFAVVAVAFGLTTVHAEDARKTAVLDTGKGGIQVFMSVPGWASGPYDTGMNPGVMVKTISNLVYGEGLFFARVSETRGVWYQSMVGRRTSVKAGDTAITAEHMAKEMLKTQGFTIERAIKIDSPDVGLNGATVVAYKAKGMSIFDGKERKKDRQAIVVMGVSLPGNTQGFSIMAWVDDDDVNAFDSNPAKYEKAAMNAFADLFKNSDWKINP